MTQTLHRSDVDLQTAVTEELHYTPSINSTHIGVSVNDGAVTLSGHVDTYPELLLATKAAQRVRGVTALAQHLSVHNEYAPTNDTDIAQHAGEALDRAVDVPESVKATVRNQHITLTGSVAWHHERQSASRAVRYLRGVKGVINEVTVRPSADASAIKKSIRAALVRNAQSEGSNITVTTDGAGTVTLTGTVGSWGERRQAEHVAWAAPGVTGLVEHLRIES
jgi:osmotically-inducible protein OsmY